MSIETAYFAMVLFAFSTFFVTITVVWFLNRLPEKAPRTTGKVEAISARRPQPSEGQGKLAA